MSRDIRSFFTPRPPGHAVSKPKNRTMRTSNSEPKPGPSSANEMNEAFVILSSDEEDDLETNLHVSESDEEPLIVIESDSEEEPAVASVNISKRKREEVESDDGINGGDVAFTPKKIRVDHPVQETNPEYINFLQEIDKVLDDVDDDIGCYSQRLEGDTEREPSGVPEDSQWTYFEEEEDSQDNIVKEESSPVQNGPVGNHSSENLFDDSSINVATVDKSTKELSQCNTSFDGSSESLSEDFAIALNRVISLTNKVVESTQKSVLTIDSSIDSQKSEPAVVNLANKVFENTQKPVLTVEGPSNSQNDELNSVNLAERATVTVESTQKSVLTIDSSIDSQKSEPAVVNLTNKVIENTQKPILTVESPSNSQNDELNSVNLAERATVTVESPQKSVLTVNSSINSQNVEPNSVKLTYKSIATVESTQRSVSTLNSSIGTQKGEPEAQEPHSTLETSPAVIDKDLFEDLIGDRATWNKLYTWLQNWKSYRWKCSVLIGPPGSGKKHAAVTLATATGWRIERFDWPEFDVEVLSTPGKNFDVEGTLWIFNNFDRDQNRHRADLLFKWAKKARGPVVFIGKVKDHPNVLRMLSLCYLIKVRKPRVDEIKENVRRLQTKVAPTVLEIIIRGSNCDLKKIFAHFSPKITNNEPKELPQVNVNTVTKSQTLTDKYKPKTSQELLGRNVQPLKRWLEEWGKRNPNASKIIIRPDFYTARNHKGLLITGPTGVGKTVFVKTVLRENSWDFVELNGLDYCQLRDLLDCCQNYGLIKGGSSRRRVLLVENFDRNQIREVVRKTRIPVICLCDCNRKCFQGLAEMCLQVHLSAPGREHLKTLLTSINHEENLGLTEGSLDTILNATSQNVATAINTLYFNNPTNGRVAFAQKLFSKRDLQDNSRFAHRFYNGDQDPDNIFKNYLRVARKSNTLEDLRLASLAADSMSVAENIRASVAVKRENFGCLGETEVFFSSILPGYWMARA